MPRLAQPTRIPIQRRNGEITDEGIEIGARDLARVRHLARWYCLSPKHLAALERELSDWHPDSPRLRDIDPSERARLLVRPGESIRRRLAKMARIDSGYGEGPLVTGVTSRDLRTVIYAPTALGGRVADTPWPKIGPVGAFYINHALLGAEVGIQLTALTAGHPVRIFSQRELDTGHSADGEDLPINYGSSLQRKNDSVDKKPDLVLSSNAGTRFIAIEIENDKNRPMEVYSQKLAAYEQNPNISATWYVCSHEATQRRVERAAAQHPLANVRVIPVRDLGNGLREADIQYTSLPTEVAQPKTKTLTADIGDVITASRTEEAAA